MYEKKDKECLQLKNENKKLKSRYGIWYPRYFLVMLTKQTWEEAHIFLNKKLSKDLA